MFHRISDGFQRGFYSSGYVRTLYSSPPPAEAQAMIKFTYEGYRITLYQDGQAVFMGRNSSE